MKLPKKRKKYDGKCKMDSKVELISLLNELQTRTLLKKTSFETLSKHCAPLLLKKITNGPPLHLKQIISRTPLLALLISNLSL